jgi:hypothetical protein
MMNWKGFGRKRSANAAAEIRTQSINGTSARPVVIVYFRLKVGYSYSPIYSHNACQTGLSESNLIFQSWFHF